MKKQLLTFLSFVLAWGVLAQNIDLPDPLKEGGMPLNEALNKRKSRRAFSTKELTLQELSNLLWAAKGVNRQYKSEYDLTVPSAGNKQEIDVYVLNKNGIYLFNPIKHKLIQKSKKDIRSLSDRQEVGLKAPLVLLYVANLDKITPKYGETDGRLYATMGCGFVSQNVYLYCASNNMATVVIGYIPRDELDKELKLTHSMILLSQPVGFPDDDFYNKMGKAARHW